MRGQQREIIADTRGPGNVRWTPPRGRLGMALLGALMGLWACDDPGSGDVASIDAVGAVGVQLFFDANGNGLTDGGDAVLQDWTVNLNQPAGGLVATQVTDEDGLAIFEDVPVGRLVPAIPESELGDTLALVPQTALAFTLSALQSVEVRPLLTLPSFSIEEVRALPQGKPLFTHGVALNGLVAGDRTLHIKTGNAYLRVLSVEEGSAFSIGDSLRVFGRTALDLGVPVLDGSVLFRLGPGGAATIPLRLSTGEAAGARGGALDAALVEIRSADILEVLDEGSEGVVLRVDDGSGALRMRFRSYLDVDPDLIDPETDSVGAGVGLLVPVRVGNSVVWEIRPRRLEDAVLLRPSG